MTSFGPPPRPPHRTAAATHPPPPAPPGDPWGPVQRRAPEAATSRAGVSVQNLLLVLGTGLVAVAMAVFTAVNWSRLDATAQGFALVALTVVAAVVARAAAGRSMPATAEAVALVALVMAIADVHALRVGLAPALGGPLYWAIGLLVVSLGAWGFGIRTGIRSTRIVAWMLAQVPLYLLTVSSYSLTLAEVGVAVLLQSAVVLTLADRCTAEPLWGRVLGAVQAAFFGGVIVAIATGTALVSGASDAAELRGSTVVLALGSLVAAYGAWLRAASDTVRPIAEAAATALGLLAVHTGCRSVFSQETSAAAVALVAALVALAACRVPARWGQVPGVLAVGVALVSSVPLVEAIASMLVAGSEAAARPGDLSAWTQAAALRVGTAAGPTPAALLVHLAAAGLLTAVVALQVVRRLLTPIVLVAVGSVLAVGPLIAPLSIGGTVVTGMLVSAGALAIAGVIPGAGDVRRSWFALAVGGYGWSMLWALSSTPLTVITVWTGVALAATLAWLAARAQESAVSIGAVASTIVGVAVGTGVSAITSGATLAMAWALSSTAVALVSVVGVLVFDPSWCSEGLRARLGRSVEVTSLAVHGLALVEVVALRDPGALSLMLATAVLALVVHGMRPGRFAVLALALAGVEAVVLTWLRLDAGGVATPEAYTLPVVVLLGAAGWYAYRLKHIQGRDLPSWTTMGPALVVAFAPSVALVLAEPQGARPLIALVAGALVLVLGAVTGQRAPVDIGVVAVSLIGLRLLVPVMAAAPNWVIIGATGVVLLAVGATFEQRRSDLRAARRQYSALR